MFQQTKLNRTVTLVEQRLQNNQSEDQIKDLDFLVDHYRATHQWDKASAATRHMVKVAEGTNNGSFEITPIDIELYQSRKRWIQRNAIRILVSFSVCYLSLLAGLYVWLDHPEFLTLARASVFTWDAQAFVERAKYHANKGDFSEGMQDCQKALSLSPGLKSAYAEKAKMLESLGDRDKAYSMNELSDHNTDDYYWTKSWIQLRRQEFAAAAETLGQWSPKIDSTTSEYHCSSKTYWYTQQAYDYALAGDFSKALNSAERATAVATSDSERQEGNAVQARYLLHLSRFNEAISRASAAITISPSPWATIYRAEAYYQKGDYQAAIADASRAIRMGNSGRMFAVRAKAYEKLGKISAAEADNRQAALLGTSLCEML